MINKTTPLLFRALLEMSEAHSAKVARGNSKRANTRHLWGSCAALAARRASLPLCPAVPVSTPSRSFINLVAPISTCRMEYTECRTLGYTLEQMYNVVASVDQYQHFVPWCTKSRVTKGRNGNIWRYTSEVTVAVCTDGSLFSHLETIWRFAPGANDQPDSCKVKFYVSFEFKSLLHSQLASVFFDEVVKQMVNAFESRAAVLYRNQQEAPLRRWST
uniref:Si:ch73-141c7.1 n=1 Tax=Sander lucioperca TaxID=283035 RepID=A0A8C9YB21_SANLU